MRVDVCAFKCIGVCVCVYLRVELQIQPEFVIEGLYQQRRAMKVFAGLRFVERGDKSRGLPQLKTSAWLKFEIGDDGQGVERGILYK